jgi:dTDP-4-dehydrorhamnose reductase
VILVFGGNGQLGRELIRSAANSGIRLTALSRSEADISNSAQIQTAIARYRPDIIVNTAAYTNVDQAEVEQEKAYSENVLGPNVLAEASRAADLPLIHISTDYVFDGTKRGAYVESDPIAPVGIYGRTKAQGEKAIREIWGKHIILRTAWVYGEFGNNFLKTILRLAVERADIKVVADQYGSPTCTRDIAQTILAITPRLINSTNLWGTYHYGGRTATTWYEFAREIVLAQAAFTGKNPRVFPISSEEFPTIAKRPKNSVLDTKCFINTFGIWPTSWPDEYKRVVTALVTQNSQ